MQFIAQVHSLPELHTQVIPHTISLLRSLRTLRLDFNQLTSLPAELGQLVHLQLLDASNNSITSLPLELGACIQLQVLNLLNNPLTVRRAQQDRTACLSCDFM